jgi:hypothetical protein
VPGPIRRRLRPRAGSFTFRRLWWVLVREAALRVLFPAPPDRSHETYWRAHLLRQRTDRIRVAAEQALRLEPARRFWPPRP